MNIEVYKKLNEELINNVQELKINVGSLEREIVNVNSRFFEERHKWIEERLEIEQKYIRIIKNLRKTLNRVCDSAVTEIKYDEVSTETPTPKTRISMPLRRSSMGVTMRSPLKMNTTNSAIPQIVTDSESPQHPPAINEETINNENEKSNTVSQVQNMWGLTNLVENTENTETQSSSCQSVNTTVDSVSDATIESQNKAVPSLRVNNRRATQVFDRSNLNVRQRSPIGRVTGASFVLSPNIDTNSNSEHHLTANAVLNAAETHTTNSNNKIPLTAVGSPNANAMDRLTMVFSENLILHSTPRSCEMANSTLENPQATMQNQFDENETLMTSATRPRRQCAPKKLVEPTLNSKMRNEGQNSNKCQTKRKKRNK